MRGYYPGDMHIGRSVIRRVEVVEVDDTGTQQLITAKGLAGEQFKTAYRAQMHGSSGVPPAGSEGYVLFSQGRPDQAFLLGVEHKDHRPRGMAAGDKVIYDAHGNIVSLVQGEIRIKCPKIVFECNLEITGNITQTGDFAQDGVHTDSNGPHTA